MEEHHARAVCAIVQDVHTGEILAMANRPTYNPNDYRSADPEAVMNRCIAAVYEPGSTLKVIAISAALEEGMVTTATVVDCENGAWMHHGRILRDHHPYGRLSVEDILKKSSNIGTAKIAVSLGDRRFERYLHAYGLGDRLKIDLPGEETGILHPVANWSGISCSRIAIGQGVAVTPLQMIGLYSAIANGGSLMRPVVVKKIVTDEGVELLVPGQQVLSRPISAKTAETMRRMLARVTDEGGTGTRARVSGIDIAGKTGTAQKAERGGYSNTKYMASFVGFLPAEAPEIAIIVVVDEPQPMHTGGYVAAPAFSKIAEQAVRYLHIVPDQFNVASR
jgi:cell division protein FtsI/penicillin-binding protein 2